MPSSTTQQQPVAPKMPEPASAPEPAVSQYHDIRHPADVDAHQADLIRRAARRQEMMPELRRCLNPEYASRREAQKGVYDFKVSCIINVVERGNHSPADFTEVVSAKDEDEAWAKFCDRIQRWPGPKYCERKIEKLEKAY